MIPVSRYTKGTAVMLLGVLAVVLLGAAQFLAILGTIVLIATTLHLVVLGHGDPDGLMALVLVLGYDLYIAAGSVAIISWLYRAETRVLEYLQAPESGHV